MSHPSLILAAYGHFAAVVGMRYHSLLFAARAEVPLIAVPYAEKCRTWLAEHAEDAVEPDGATWIERLRNILDKPMPARARRVAS